MCPSLLGALLSSEEEAGGPAAGTRGLLRQRTGGDTPELQKALLSPGDIGRRGHSYDDAVAAFPVFRPLSALVACFWVFSLFIST